VSNGATARCLTLDAGGPWVMGHGVWCLGRGSWGHELWVMGSWIMGQWLGYGSARVMARGSWDYGLWIVGRRGSRGCARRGRARAQALVHLALELGELAATLGILWRCLRGCGAGAAPPWRRLRPGLRWRRAADFMMAMASFPLVEMAAARSIVRRAGAAAVRASARLTVQLCDCGASRGLLTLFRRATSPLPR